MDAEAAAGSNISLGCPAMAKDKSVEVLIRELQALQLQRDGPDSGSVPWQSLNCVCGFDAILSSICISAANWSWL